MNFVLNIAMNIQFAWPWAFAVLPLPLVFIWLLPRATLTNDAALRVPFFHALQTAVGHSNTAHPRMRLLLAIMAWLLLINAAARPQVLGETVQLPVTGRDLLLAVDISGSMQTEDMVLSNRRATRLEVVKTVAGEFIQRRKGDRLGLILFGDQAYVQTPLTFDVNTVGILLDEAAIGLAGKQTAIGDAIGLAVKRLRDQTEGNRVLILLTDGANSAGSIEPLKAADLAAAEGVRIYTIGVGADEMTMRGLFGTQRVPNTELDEQSLKTIAEKTGGRFFRALDTAGLETIYTLLDTLEPAGDDDLTFRPVHELYRWPLATSFLICIALALASAGLPRSLTLAEARHV